MAEPGEPAETYRRGPSVAVDRALIVDTISEIHRLISLIDAKRDELLPGELQESFHDAWVKSSHTLHALAAAADGIPRTEDITVNVEGHELTGVPGKFKRDTWTVARNGYLGLFHTAPRTPEQLRAAWQEFSRAADIGSVIVASVADSEAGRAASEFVSMTKHALEIAARRR